MAIEKIKHYSLTTPATVYDEEALTCLELCARATAKVNEIIDTVNRCNEKHTDLQSQIVGVGNDLDQAVNDVIPNIITDWMDAHQDTPLAHPDCVCPETFGAYGDGEHDDTAALQATFSQAQTKGSGMVYLQGQYSVSSNLVLPSGVKVYGHGTIIGDAWTTLYMTVYDNCVIDNVNFEGIGVNVQGSNVEVRNAQVNNTMSSGFVVHVLAGQDHRNIKFTNCNATKTGGHGFNVGSNSHVSDVGRAGATVSNIEFDNCTAIECGDARGNGYACGFAIQATGCTVGNIAFNNCTAINPYESGFHVEYDVDRKNITYVGCHAEQCGDRKNDPEYGCGFMLHKNHRFVGCTVKDCHHVIYQSNDNMTFAPSDFPNFDIVNLNNGMNIKDLLYRGAGVCAFDMGTCTALIGTTFTNATTRPVYNPVHFWSGDKPLMTTIENGRITFAKTLDPEAQNTVSTPLFPVCGGTSYLLTSDGIPSTYPATPTSVKISVCTFDANGNNLGMANEGQMAWRGSTTNPLSVSFVAPQNAVYACISINPAHTTGTTVDYNAPMFTALRVKESV